MADGHLNKCKECTKKDVTENREKNYEHYLQFDKTRSKTEKRKRLRREVGKEYRGKHPERISACLKVRRARKKGLITPPESCPRCGYKGKLVGHHHDYSKPLEVEWMCQRCHKKLHAEIKKSGRFYVARDNIKNPPRLRLKMLLG